MTDMPDTQEKRDSSLRQTPFGMTESEFFRASCKFNKA